MARAKAAVTAVRSGSGPVLDGCHRLADIGSLAARTLPPEIRDFIDGGSGDEVTLRANRCAFDTVALVPRVLSGVQHRTTEGRIFASSARLPLAVAPMAFQRWVHPGGEIASARAAAAAGIPFAVSLMSSTAVEQVVATGAAVWMQLYGLRDRRLLDRVVGRAEDAGCDGLMLTVDMPVMARRLRDVRHGLRLPDRVRPVHLGADGDSHGTEQDGMELFHHPSIHFDPGLSWADLDWLRARTRLPLAVKGVLAPVDASRAIAAGADAVVVSNHGGRQLDGTVTSVAALPAVVEAVAGQGQVLLDSGVRSGVHVLKALAMGASGVLIGRPILWGLGLGGEDGVARVLELLGTELDEAMALAGCSDRTAAGNLTTMPTGCCRNGTAGG
ncbi:alpha-hydroxy acid oxidase [Micromonospora sp. LOL_021]|uniref:alpha-hydroxy acid oxidase n=1 Tax=Micromonospora sp. LOL_021 TaxID=3345417 RepID=UPI003A84EE72